MNSRISRLALLTIIALLAFGPARGAESTTQPSSHPVTRVELRSSITIMRGVPKWDVLTSLGRPSRQLGDSVWLYRNFDAGGDHPRKDDCRTLMLTFADKRVSDIQLINDGAERVFAAKAEAKAKAAAEQVAAK